MKKKNETPEVEEPTGTPKEKTATEIAYEKLFQEMVDEFRNNYQPSVFAEGCEFLSTEQIIEMWSSIAELREESINQFMVESGFTTKLIGNQFKWIVRPIRK